MDEYNLQKYDGIIISGGFLPKKCGSILKWYERLITTVKIPLLAICLGHRIFCYVYGSRIRRLKEGEFGLARVQFHKDFPLAPNRKELTVFQRHHYDVFQIPDHLENYGGTEKSQIQAIKHKEKLQFSVQFHPEVKENNEGYVIFDNFIELLK
jgi:GMP synthase-like glutamine amidotransferase